MRIPNCFVCDKQLSNISTSVEFDSGLGFLEKDATEINQPSGGLSFAAEGHYGSAAFDSVDRSKWLEINICDECVEERMERILIGIRLPQGFTKAQMYEPWNPHKHN